MLKEGLTDAIGFIGGALLAYWLGKLLGFDPLAEGYNSGSIGGILMVGVGGGRGLQLARRVRPRKDQ